MGTLEGAMDRIGHALDFLRARKRNYQLAFGNPAGQEVLRDLITFCRACETCFEGDRDKHLIAEGRREVYLRIARHLHLSSEELFELYRGGSVKRLIVEK